MNYFIWKLAHGMFSRLSARAAGILLTLSYIAFISLFAFLAYLVFPHEPKWRNPDVMAIWEWVLLAGVAFWIAWGVWMLFWGDKKMWRRYKAELARKEHKKKLR